MASLKQRIHLRRTRHLRNAFTTILADRINRGVVAIEVARELAESQQDWSAPVQMRFVQQGGEWTIIVRSIAQVHERAVAERAARQ